VIIEIDASDYVSPGGLSQYDDDEGVLNPVAHYSKKHTPAECNYDICHTGQMAISDALEKWRLECEPAVYPLQLLTNHKNFEHFMMKTLLN